MGDSVQKLFESLVLSELDDTWTASTWTERLTYGTGTLQTLARSTIAVSHTRQPVSTTKVMIEADTDDKPDKHDQRPKTYISSDSRRRPFFLSTRPTIVSPFP